jgi:hypothetical protein
MYNVYYVLYCLMLSIAQGGIRAMKYPGPLQFDSLAATITQMVNQQTQVHSW